MKHYKYWFLERILDEESQTAYFYGANLNMLYEYDLKKKCVRQLGAFPDMPVSNQLFRGGIKHKNKLFFPPRMADKMGVYDIENRSFQTKDIYAQAEDGGNRFLPNESGYISIKYQDKKGFFIYRNTPFCVAMDLDSEELSYIVCKDTGENIVVGVEYFVWDHLFVAPILGQNKVLLLNMRDAIMEIRELPMDADDSCCSLAASEDGEFYLLTCKEPSVIRWDPRTNEIARIATLPLGAITYEHGYWMRSIEKNLRIFPGLDLEGSVGAAFEVDVPSGQVKEESLFEPYQAYIKWSLISEKGKHVYAMAPTGQDIFFTDELIFVEYDWGKSTIVEKELPLPQGISESDMARDVKNYQELVHFRYLMDNVPIYTENDYLSFEGWMRGFLAEEGTAAAVQKNCENNVGETIYHALINE